MNTKADTNRNEEPVATELSDDQLEKVAGGASVRSWSTSGDADDRPTEEVAFYYNKIAFAYSTTSAGKK